MSEEHDRLPTPGDYGYPANTNPPPSVDCTCGWPVSAYSPDPRYCIPCIEEGVTDRD